MNEVFSMIPAPAKTLWFVGSIAALIGAVVCVLVFVGYSARHTRFEVSPEGLRISGDFFGRLIAAESLETDRARRVDLAAEPELRPRWRTMGSGLPGYQSGWFRLRNREKALVYLTDRSRVVHLPTSLGYSLLLSVEQPELFLEALARAVAR